MRPALRVRIIHAGVRRYFEGYRCHWIEVNLIYKGDTPLRITEPVRDVGIEDPIDSQT